MRKVCLLFTALTLSAGLWALDNVRYIDADGQEKTVHNVTEIINSSTTLDAGWYVVNGADVQAGTLICNGDVRLILADGAKLTATGKGDPHFTPGIQVSGETNSLTIYAQSTGEQVGQLIAKGGKWAAGIGGGKGADGNNITISGGKITATGYTAAGIGGGYGGNCSNITINGGTVTATGGGLGAGIGGGDRGNGSNITINGGKVTANGGDCATGIGGGDRGNGSNLLLNGGIITANGGNNAVAIGNGYQATKAAFNIFVSTKGVVKAGTTKPLTEDNIVDHTSADDIANLLVGKRYATVVGPTMVPTAYIDENGVSRNVAAYMVADSASSVTWGIKGESTWYVVNGADVQLDKGAICQGDVRLILADGAKLTAMGWLDESIYMGYAGIQVVGEDNSLTIYAQADQSGQLIAIGEYAAAGIGGKSSEAGSNITINGGMITATGGRLGSGIGGGAYGSGSQKIIINGGTVTAIGGDYAAGIAGGYGYYASDVYISDAYMLYAGANETLTDDDIVTHSSAQDLGMTLVGQQYVKMEGLATPYTRSMTIGQWATVCLPYAATSFSGATFYKINYHDGADKLYIEEVHTLEAGMPYIFEATAETVIINHEDATLTNGEEQTERGLHGSFARKVIESDGSQAAISGGSVVVAEEYSTITIPACRAYINMEEVPTVYQPTSAPLRCMGVPRGQATDNPSLHHSINSSFKMIKDGQLIIVKDGKTYNVVGMEVK